MTGSLEHEIEIVQRTLPVGQKLDEFTALQIWLRHEAECLAHAEPGLEGREVRGTLIDENAAGAARIDLHAFLVAMKEQGERSPRERREITHQIVMFALGTVRLSFVLKLTCVSPFGVYTSFSIVQFV